MSEFTAKSDRPPIAKTDEELYDRAVSGEASDRPDSGDAEPYVESNSSNYGGSAIPSEADTA
jgi:hypothetical protein